MWRLDRTIRGAQFNGIAGYTSFAASEFYRTAGRLTCLRTAKPMGESKSGDIGFVKLAVAVNQSQLALLKLALHSAGVTFYVSTDCDATAGPHPDFFPVFVATDDKDSAIRALKRFHLESTLIWP